MNLSKSALVAAFRAELEAAAGEGQKEALAVRAKYERLGLTSDDMRGWKKLPPLKKSVKNWRQPTRAETQEALQELMRGLKR